ncbi:unnamed protein product [Urochloa humidicola]
MPPNPHASAPPKLLRRPQPAPASAATSQQTQPPASTTQTTPPCSPARSETWWRETPPPPPPVRSESLDLLEDFVVPPTPESNSARPSYADVVRRTPPPSPSRRHLRSDDIPRCHLRSTSARSSPRQPRRQLRSAITVPSRSTYYAARASPGFNARRDGLLQSLRGAAPSRPEHPRPRPSPLAPTDDCQPGWTRVQGRQWRKKFDKPASYPPRHTTASRLPPTAKHNIYPPTAKQHSRRPPTASTTAARAIFHLKTQGRCFKCLARDHRSNVCRDPFRCLLCFRSGHKQSRCPSAPKRRQPPRAVSDASRQRVPNDGHKQWVPRTSSSPLHQPTIRLHAPTKPRPVMTGFRVGDPELRPDHDCVHIPTSFEIERELRD